MTYVISVGSVDIPWTAFSDWTYPQFGTLVAILSDGSTVDNEVLQSAAVPRRRATLSGWLFSAGDVDTLNGYNATKAVVAVGDDGDSRNANILDFNVTRVQPGLWTCSLSLVEAAEGS